MAHAAEAISGKFDAKVAYVGPANEKEIERWEDQTKTKQGMTGRTPTRMRGATFTPETTITENLRHRGTPSLPVDTVLARGNT